MQARQKLVHPDQMWSSEIFQLFPSSIRFDRIFVPRFARVLYLHHLNIKFKGYIFRTFKLCKHYLPEMWLDNGSAKKSKFPLGRGSSDRNSMKLADETPLLRNFIPTPGVRSWVGTTSPKGSEADPNLAIPWIVDPAYKLQGIRKVEKHIGTSPVTFRSPV